jgi:hypothetical protein
MRSRKRRWHFGASKRLVPAALLFAAVSSCVMAQSVSFPGARSETKSPDGHIVIKNSDSDVEDPAHTLTLTDRRNGSVVKIYQYGRGVDILWSPASDAFVINDHEGSNVSHPVLFIEPWSKKYTDLREKLIDYLRSRNQARSVLENHHVYFTAQRWLSDNELLCRVTGYGDVDPKGFTRYYIYKLGVGFRPQR